MTNLATFRRTYLIGAVIIWVGLLLAVALTLADSPYLTQVLPLLAGGVVWFVVIIPGVLYATR